MRRAHSGRADTFGARKGITCAAGTGSGALRVTVLIGIVKSCKRMQRAMASVSLRSRTSAGRPQVGQVSAVRSGTGNSPLNGSLGAARSGSFFPAVLIDDRQEVPKIRERKTH